MSGHGGGEGVSFEFALDRFVVLGDGVVHVFD